MVFKAPGYGPQRLQRHRDPAHCRIDHGGINVGIYLDDADRRKRDALGRTSGSHKKNSTNLQLEEEIDAHGFDHFRREFPCPAKAGDLVIHNENVLHGSRLASAASGTAPHHLLRRPLHPRQQLGARFGCELDAQRRLTALPNLRRRLRSRGPEFAHETFRSTGIPIEQTAASGIGDDEYVEFRLME